MEIREYLTIAISAHIVHILKGSGSSSYQTLFPQGAGEGVSTAQASEAPTEVFLSTEFIGFP